MRFRFYALFGFLFLFCLSLDVLMFGGVSQEAGVGAAIADSARAQAPLAHTYIVLGRPIAARVAAARTAGQSIAAAAFGDSYDSIAATPDAAIDLLFSESRGPMRALLMLAYWGAPVFFVLAILAWLFRTRRTHLIKSARR
ncbi:MAG: hypothetical protein JSS21_09720 [Proteobacteria bacterium]|nr:hypothetical protein [Pseudomonadota bacterium]